MKIFIFMFSVCCNTSGFVFIDNNGKLECKKFKTESIMKKDWLKPLHTRISDGNGDWFSYVESDVIHPRVMDTKLTRFNTIENYRMNSVQFTYISCDEEGDMYIGISDNGANVWIWWHPSISMHLKEFLSSLHKNEIYHVKYQMGNGLYCIIISMSKYGGSPAVSASINWSNCLILNEDGGVCMFGKHDMDPLLTKHEMETIQEDVNQPHSYFPVSFFGFSRVCTLSKKHFDTSIVLTEDGSVWGWGGTRKLGDITSVHLLYQATPKMMGQDMFNHHPISFIVSDGDTAFLALNAAGEIFSWGDNHINTMVTFDVLKIADRELTGGANIVSITSVENGMIFLLTEHSKVWLWMRGVNDNATYIDLHPKICSDINPRIVEIFSLSNVLYMVSDARWIYVFSVNKNDHVTCTNLQKTFGISSSMTLDFGGKFNSNERMMSIFEKLMQTTALGVDATAVIFRFMEV